MLSLFETIYVAHYYWRMVVTAVVYRTQLGRVGRQSIIFTPLMIRHPRCIFIGERCLIRKGVRLEVIRQSSNAVPRLVIGDGTNIEQNVHIVCKHEITIGSNVSITANCAIVDVTHPFDGLPEDAKPGNVIAETDSSVVIGDGVFLGIGTVVLPNVQIGERAVIGANSVVTGNIPAFAVAAGVPAKVLRFHSRDQMTDSGPKTTIAEEKEC